VSSIVSGTHSSHLQTMTGFTLVGVTPLGSYLESLDDAPTEALVIDAGGISSSSGSEMESDLTITQIGYVLMAAAGVLLAFFVVSRRYISPAHSATTLASKSDVETCDPIPGTFVCPTHYH
jgi:hypothetical protein